MEPWCGHGGQTTGCFAGAKETSHGLHVI